MKKLLKDVDEGRPDREVLPGKRKIFAWKACPKLSWWTRIPVTSAALTQDVRKQVSCINLRAAKGNHFRGTKA